MHFIDFKIYQEYESVSFYPKNTDIFAKIWPELSSSFNSGGAGVHTVDMRHADEIKDLIFSKHAGAE